MAMSSVLRLESEPSFVENPTVGNTKRSLVKSDDGATMEGCVDERKVTSRPCTDGNNGVAVKTAMMLETMMCTGKPTLY